MVPLLYEILCNVNIVWKYDKKNYTNLSKLTSDIDIYFYIVVNFSVKKLYYIYFVSVVYLLVLALLLF